MILHALFAPPLRKKKCRPSILNSLDSFLLFVESPEDMAIKLDNRKLFCEKEGIQFHPLIFGKGSSETQMNGKY